MWIPSRGASAWVVGTRGRRPAPDRAQARGAAGRGQRGGPCARPPRGKHAKRSRARRAAGRAKYSQAPCRTGPRAAPSGLVTPSSGSRVVGGGHSRGELSRQDAQGLTRQGERSKQTGEPGAQSKADKGFRGARRRCGRGAALRGRSSVLGCRGCAGPPAARRAPRSGRGRRGACGPGAGSNATSEGSKPARRAAPCRGVAWAQARQGRGPARRATRWLLQGPAGHGRLTRRRRCAQRRCGPPWRSRA
jgi:hypothetical protein